MNFILEIIKKNKKLSIYVFISFIIILSFIIYFFTNISHSSLNIDNYSDKVKIELLIKKINYLNSYLDKSIVNTTLDTKTASTNLSYILNELNNLNLSISNLEIADSEYNEVKNKLILCINSTSDLYNYCNFCLTATEKESIEIITNRLDNLKKECIQDYNTLSSYGFQLKYTNTMDTFLSSLIRYLSNLNNLTLNKEIINTANETFKKAVSTSINSFSSLLEDLQPAILKIREDGRSLDVLLDDLSLKEKKFNEIKDNFTYISIPNGYLPYYTSLNETFNLYSKYLTAIKIAIIYEKSTPNYSNNKKSIDKNYKNAFQKYNDVVDSFNYAVKSLKNL